MSLLAACRGDLADLLASREVDDEVISVELHHFADQVGAHVKTSALPAVLVTSVRGDHHPNRESTVARQREVLTQKLHLLGLG